MPSIYYFLTGANGSGHALPLEQLWALQIFFRDWPNLALLIAVAVPCLVLFLVIQALAGGSTYIERKLAADIQCRVGPNKCNVGVFFGEFARVSQENAKNPRAGLLAKLMGGALGAALPLLNVIDKIVGKLAPGVLIFLADGIKLVLKEDIIPDPVDKPLFKAAPVIVLLSAFAAAAVLPYSDAWYASDFNIGIFYIAAVTSIEVLGVLMAGWASNNKWALLGGMRSAAQIVSYELPVGIAICAGITIAGTMSMQAMTYDQFAFTSGGSAWSQGWFWQWNLFNPFMFILAPVYCLSALAECNRTPFDIPEAESELVSGYHTEYSGMRFAFFFMAEYAMMYATSAIAVTLFLGGWSTGIAPLEHVLMSSAPLFDAQGILTQAPEFHWFGTILHLLVFGLKTFSLVFIMMWIRWTLPRFRVDQMMTLCWKKLIPISLFCLFGVATWMLIKMFLARHYGSEQIETIFFWTRCVFAFSFIGWLVWFFAKPLSTEQKAQRDVLAHAPVMTSAL